RAPGRPSCPRPGGLIWSHASATAVENGGQHERARRPGRARRGTEHRHRTAHLGGVQAQARALHAERGPERRRAYRDARRARSSATWGSPDRVWPPPDAAYGRPGRDGRRTKMTILEQTPIAAVPAPEAPEPEVPISEAASSYADGGASGGGQQIH